MAKVLTMTARSSGSSRGHSRSGLRKIRKKNVSFAGELIRSAREGLELSQTEVAKAIGFSNVFLNRIELGNCDLPPSHIDAVTKVLKLDKAKIIKALKDDLGARLELEAK